MTSDAFRDIRKAMGLTQQGLADLMGVTQATVSRWESGELDIDVRTATTLRSLQAIRASAA
jgi:transcriptional regulator with XRE-family HTH domain